MAQSGPGTWQNLDRAVRPDFATCFNPILALQLVDVRSRAEWLKGHLPGAISVPLLDLDPNNRPFDPSKPSLVYCYEGYRATTAASILLRESAGDVGILIDGIEGWSALGLPLELPETHR